MNTDNTLVFFSVYGIELSQTQKRTNVSGFLDIVASKHMDSVPREGDKLYLETKQHGKLELVVKEVRWKIDCSDLEENCGKTGVYIICSRI